MLERLQNFRRGGTHVCKRSPNKISLQIANERNHIHCSQVKPSPTTSCKPEPKGCLGCTQTASALLGLQLDVDPFFMFSSGSLNVPCPPSEIQAWQPPAVLRSWTEAFSGTNKSSITIKNLLGLMKYLMRKVLYIESQTEYSWAYRHVVLLCGWEHRGAHKALSDRPQPFSLSQRDYFRAVLSLNS